MENATSTEIEDSPRIHIDQPIFFFQTFFENKKNYKFI